MKENRQDRIMKELDEKINSLKKVLEETIVKHSDAEYDLNDMALDGIALLDYLEVKKAIPSNAISFKSYSASLCLTIVSSRTFFKELIFSSNSFIILS
jgi:hypothetical protein